jgi:predicted nucleotide-binding protein (sugar kinase/HSP70/actin superfamily)
MTIDEAVTRYKNNAEYERTHGNLQGCLEFRQLAEWLKDYKRLLEQEIIYKSAESKLKNPKAKNFDILCFFADNAGLSNFEAIEKAYHMGVSEQEAVLDKIRAEIQENINYNKKMNYQGIVAGLLLTLNIIDKYTAGNEPKDGEEE